MIHGSPSLSANGPRLNDDVRRAVADAFENWVATEEERSDGLRRIDYLRGRETTGFAEAQVF
jgi:hypothetical protein